MYALPACLFSLRIHRDSIPPLRARFAADSVLRPTPTLMRLPVFIHCPMFPFLCQVVTFRVFRHCIKEFSSSSASPPSPARLSAAPRSRRSCRRHPSSPPTSASRRSASRLPLPLSSLLSCVVSFLDLVARMLDLRVCVPSTGKSSNSSSSSSCAPGFCGWRGWLVSFESETTALVVFWLPCAAPDMV